MLFDIVARISELIVLKFDFWRDGLEDVPKSIPAPDFKEAIANLLDSNLFG